MAQIPQNNVKVALLGSPGVGKTCIIKKYTEDKFNENTLSSKGVSYSQKVLEIDNKKVFLELWDTAGQEKYRSLGRYFYKDAYIVCLVYDITNLQSFKDLEEIWYKDLKTYGEKNKVLAVVGSKSDCFIDEKVPEEIARKYAEKINAIFMLTSAKIGSNIDFLFETLVRKYLEPEFTKKVDEMKKEKGEVTKVTAENNQEDNNKKKRKCC